MKMMIVPIALGLAYCMAASAAAQAESPEQETKVENPFDNPTAADAGMPSAGGYGAAPGGYGAAGGGYGAAGAYGSGASMMSAADPFRVGLSRLLKRLSTAKSDAERKQLMEYAREAFTSRYKQQLDSREARIRELEMRLAELREEQSRRAEATERIVDLQMQSLDLVAEGLLDANQFLNLGSGVFGSSPGMPGMDGSYGGPGGYPGGLPGMGFDMSGATDPFGFGPTSAPAASPPSDPAGEP